MDHSQRNGRKTLLGSSLLFLTGAAAASAAVVTGGGPGAEAHSPELEWENFLPRDWETSPAHWGKLYSDKAVGWPCYGLAEPNLSICYMTVQGDRSAGAQNSAYTNAISGGYDKWYDTDTTIAFDPSPFDWEANDVHFKTADMSTEWPPRYALTELFDYHHSYCPPTTGCNDPDGLPEHQPTNWWYATITLNTNGPRFLDLNADQEQAIVAHELGHVLGTDDYFRGCDYPAITIMDVECILSPPIPLAPVYDPTNVDVCQANHVAWPWGPSRYGDAVRSDMSPLYYAGCEGLPGF